MGDYEALSVGKNMKAKNVSKGPTAGGKAATAVNEDYLVMSVMTKPKTGGAVAAEKSKVLPAPAAAEETKLNFAKSVATGKTSIDAESTGSKQSQTGAPKSKKLLCCFGVSALVALLVGVVVTVLFATGTFESKTTAANKPPSVASTDAATTDAAVSVGKRDVQRQLLKMAAAEINENKLIAKITEQRRPSFPA